MAIVTGSAISAAASIALITFLVIPLSRGKSSLVQIVLDVLLNSFCSFNMFSLFLGRIYTLTMLYVLIHRDAISQGVMNVVIESDTFQSAIETGQHSGKSCHAHNA